MKKYLIFALLFIPIASFGAPSVKILGSKSSSSGATTAATSAKVVPARVATSAANTTSSSRIGTLRTKTKSSSGANTGVITTSNSRFPVITPAGSYNSVVTPGASYGSTTVVSGNVDTTTIVNSVMNNVRNNYYDKNTVYNNNAFYEAVRNVDDPRIDAIRTEDPSDKHSESLPSNYVYIWIEQ